MDCEKDQTVGFEFEFDPNGQNVDPFVRDGGAESEVGMDGSGNGNTIEVRLNPVDSHDPETFSSYLDSVMDSLLSHQPRVLYGGCGRSLPIGTHVHVDLPEKDKIKTVAHFAPLYAIFNSRIEDARVSKRIAHGYGTCGAIRSQGPSESVSNKLHLEYRGLPNMVTPFSMGFTYGWACRIYDKGVSVNALNVLKKHIDNKPRIDTLDTHTEWGFPEGFNSSGGKTRAGGTLRDKLEEFSSGLYEHGIANISSYVLHKKRLWKAMYYLNDCIYAMKDDGKIHRYYRDDLTAAIKKNIPKIIFKTNSSLFLVRKDSMDNFGDYLEACLEVALGSGLKLKKNTESDTFIRDAEITRKDIISGYAEAIKD